VKEVKEAPKEPKELKNPPEAPTATEDAAWPQEAKGCLGEGLGLRQTQSLNWVLHWPLEANREKKSKECWYWVYVNMVN
jgi:hypothetical protein